MSQRHDDAMKKTLLPARGLRMWLRDAVLAAKLRHDEKGFAAVEFAIIAPLFFFLMFVIAETAMIFIAEQVMDNALLETTRLVRTGQAQSGTWPNPDDEAAPHPMTAAEFKDAVCGRMSVFVDCSGSDFYLDMASYDSFAEMNTTAPVAEDETFQTPGTFEFGGPGDIVVVRAYYQWPTSRIFGSLSLKNLNNGKRLIGSFAAFCNEPYVSGASSDGCG
jgi:Flp pilus assembly protein TadG